MSCAHSKRGEPPFVKSRRAPLRVLHCSSRTLCFALGIKSRLIISDIVHVYFTSFIKKESFLSLWLNGVCRESIDSHRLVGNILVIVMQDPLDGLSL